MAHHEEKSDKQEVQTAEGAERTRSARVYSPPVDIYTEGDTIVLVADMPGVSEENLDITLEKNVLTVEGYVQNRREEGYELAYAEYGEGDYFRRFTISDEVDRENIEATVKNGVLRLELPKAPEAKMKKISVKAA